MDAMEDIPLDSIDPFDTGQTSTNPFDDELKNVVQESNLCTKDVINCQSLSRIQSALVELGDNPNNNIANNDDKYCQALLNDFYHIKYHHNIHKDHIQFDKVFSFLTKDDKLNKTQCDIAHCQLIKKHFSDRTLSQTLLNNNNNNPDNNDNNEYIIDILCRIHTYLLHSYDIYRLHPNDILAIDKQLNTMANDDEIENIKLKYLSNIMKNKINKYKLIMHHNNVNKFSELYDDVNYDQLDLKSLINNSENEEKSETKFSQQQQDKLTQFKVFTNADDQTAEKFLIALAWDMGQATDRYFLYNGDILRLPVPPSKKAANEGKNADDKKDDEKHQSDAQDIEIYNIGIRFSVWESMKNDERYMAAKHDHLKEEMSENAHLKCTVSVWNKVHYKCVCLMENEYIRKRGLSIQHLYAMRLYTCYPAWSALLCAAFRVQHNENIVDVKNKVVSFAKWAELLVQTVHRFGVKVADNNDKISFFRVVNRGYKCHKIIGRFNVPLSASTNFNIMQQFACAPRDGMIMELSQYRDKNAAYFDCSFISSFDLESEVLFFGDENVLRIACIYDISQVSQGKACMSYRYYMEGLHAILRLMYGLSIEREMMTATGQKIMKNILNHILTTSQYHMNDLPQYIEKLLYYYLTNMSDEIKYNYHDIMDEHCYGFLSDIFIKEKDGNKILNIGNLCNLFVKCKTIIILMPDDFIMNDGFCASLIEDITHKKIANDVSLIFLWSQPMLLGNHYNLETYMQQFSLVNWQLHFSSTCIKLTSILQFLSENEIARQQALLQRYDNNSIHEINKYKFNFGKGKGEKRLFYSSEEKIPLLIHGFIREFNLNMYECIPLDIINLTIFMYGDYDTIFWKISGNHFWNLIAFGEVGDDNEEQIFDELVSEPYSINILDYAMRFQLKIKLDSGNIILSLHAITDAINTKQAITVQYTMICEETQCEYRQMDVIGDGGDGDGEGSEWFEDFLSVKEIQKLNQTQGIKEVNFICNLKVLHIWSQEEEEDDEVELMKIYHCGGTMKQQYEYKWILSQNITPSNVTKEYTLWYSARFDEKNWTLVFVERASDFLVALKLLALPFGIGLLVVQCHIKVRRKSVENKCVIDSIVQQFKYGDDNKGNMAESKEWSKEDLFGAKWRTEFTLSDLIIDVRLEIIHLEGINEEQIFRINWPLYGVLCDQEKKFKKNNFVLTKEQFETETFGFNYMIGVLTNQIAELKEEVKQLKDGNDHSNNNEYVVMDESDSQEVREWLMKTVKLPNYYDLFIQNGFNSLQVIKEINDKNDLRYIGIKMKAHQIMIMNKIKLLKKQK